MTDDIVTRLRESNGMTTSRSDDGFLSIHPDTDLMRQAADEIERLRKAINSLLVNIDDAHDNVGKYGLCITCDVADGSWPCVHRIVLDELKDTVHYNG